MCEYYASKYIYKCGHTEEVWVKTERCAEAEARGSDCADNNLKRKEMGSSKRRDDCQQCNDEGYGRT